MNSLCTDLADIAHLCGFGLFKFELFKLSNISSNFKRNPAVSAPDGGKAFTLTYIKMAAATVWLKTCVATFTFIFLNPFGLSGLSDGQGRVFLIQNSDVFPACYKIFKMKIVLYKIVSYCFYKVWRMKQVEDLSPLVSEPWLTWCYPKFPCQLLEI